MNYFISTHLADRLSRRAPGAGHQGWMLLMVLLGPLLHAQGPVTGFTSPAAAEVTVPEGHIVLRWEAEASREGAPLEYQLEQLPHTSGASARVAYQGADGGTFVSGLPAEGATFRVRARAGNDGTWGPWSAPATVHVDYPSRWRVGVLSAAGGLMFLILLGVTLRGARQTAAAD